MTGDQSRHLKVGDRVRWKHSATDLGTVTATAWSGVTISWDICRADDLPKSAMPR
jgi:hypothetical protein